MASGAHFDEESQAEKGGAGAPPGPDAPAPPAGDGGQPPLAGITDGLDPLDTGSVQKFSADAQRVKDLADAGPGNGGFAINEAGGQRYIAMCDRYLDGYGDIQGRLDQLAAPPKLGSGPYAQRVGEQDVLVAHGDGQSLIPNLEEMRRGFETFRQAIETAMRNYREEDAAHDQRFRAIQNGQQ